LCSTFQIGAYVGLRSCATVGHDHFFAPDRENASWLPPWQPGDITESGRAQVCAIGFTL